MVALKLFTAVTMVWLLALAVPVLAQSFDEQVAQCVNEAGQVTPAAQIAGCTALLTSGRFDVQDRSTIHNNRGVAYRAQGDLAHAITDSSEAIRLNPQYADAYYNRGTAYHDQGDLARAIADYNEAIRLNPQDALAYLNRGVAYRAQGDLARAITDYSEAIRLNPQYALAYSNRARAHDQLGDAARAKADLAEATRLQNP